MTLNEMIIALHRIASEIEDSTDPIVQVGELEFRHDVDDVYLSAGGKEVIILI